MVSPGVVRRAAMELSGTQQWLVAVTATIVSTYALDAVATMAGLALVASGLMSGWDKGLVLSFLAGSYVLWWAGLRVNLEANWHLLKRTGTSTNLLSKAAHDVVARRTASARARRFAADVGYVGSELAKEAPYYAGAFGAALVSDAVSANDALTFLAGANIGAGAYEYGLARGVRAFVRGRHAAYASFDDDWVPRDYLADYYQAVEPDERATIAFFVDAAREWEPDQPVLYFGVGPTLHHVFCAATKASEIHLGDYLPANLREIERWIERDPAAHDWRPFVRYTLECEGVPVPTEAQITEREELTRGKITRLMVVDLRRSDPLGPIASGRYSTVVSAYCADSATDDRETWRTYMQRIAGLVRPRGTLLVAALRRCRGYRVGSKTFPSANVDEHHIQAVLKPFFPPDGLAVEARRLGEAGAKGYASIVLARASGQVCSRGH